MAMGQAPPFGAPPDLGDHKRKAAKATTWFTLGVVAFCGCNGLGLMAAVLLPVYAQARSAAMKAQSRSNVSMIGTAAAVYSADHNDRLPLAENWQDALSAYQVGAPPVDGSIPKVKADIYQPPYKQKPGSYAFNSSMSGLRLSDVVSPFWTILIFESVREGRNIHGGSEILRREESRFVAGSCDFAPRIIELSDIGQFRWKPH